MSSQEESTLLILEYILKYIMLK